MFQISLEQLDPHDPTDALARTLLARVAGLREPGWPFPRRFLVETAPEQEAADPDAPPPAEEAIERLLQLGLLETEGAGRLRLHRLLAGFAWTALDGARVLAAFAPTALQWVATLIIKAMDLWLVRSNESRVMLDVEQPLCNQFLDWGYTHEERAGICVSAQATASLRNYWVLSGMQGLEAIHERLHKALTAAHRLKDWLAQANTLRVLGEVQQFRDEREAALQSYTIALQLYRAIGDRQGEATTLWCIGGIQRFQGEMQTAQTSYQAALELYQSLGERLGEANTHKALGDIHEFRKETEAALVSYQAALELYRDVRDRLGEANTLRSIGDIQRFRSEQDAALESYKVALELYQGMGERLGEATTLRDIGEVQQFQGELEAALVSYQTALRLYRALCSRLGEANTLRSIGDVQQSLNQWQAALVSYDAALELYQELGGRLGEANTLRSIGEVQQSLNQWEAAQVSYSAALRLYQAVGSRLGEANVLGTQSQLWLDVDPVRSKEMLETALVLHQTIGDSYSEAAILGNYGLMLLDRGYREEALLYLHRARAIFATHELIAQVQQTDLLIAEAQAIRLSEQSAPLLQAIAAVALGNEGLRAEVEAVLAGLEQEDFHLTAAVQAIWTGQRDFTSLTADLDDADTELIGWVLALLDEAETVQDQKHAALLARAQAAVAAVGPDLAARAALADRLGTAAAAYTSGTPAERALAAQLRALAAQLGDETG
ncbi:MAG TPA: tetratricopeptide repeat protein [Roseiflexaceae bacterium]|nr:tetratricopeptide repeat protein [Roseiflexaceae bacterium]